MRILLVNAGQMILSLTYSILFAAFVIVFAIQPWWLMYRYSIGISFFLHKILRYRVNVARENLRNSFPDKTDAERYAIEKKFYSNLADITVEALRGFTIFNATALRRYKILNPEFLDKYFHQHQSLIGVTGHICNWEWGAISAGLQLKHKPVAIYAKLSNPFIDRFMRWNRSLRGTVMAPTGETFKTFERFKGEPCIYLLVADQCPVNLESAHWTTFLNQDTACLHGPEKYARMYNYPVVFIDIKRVKRGYYTVELSDLIKNPKECIDVGAITQAYMGKLEEVIIRNPECWLWTHRRWKRKRPG